MGSNYDIWRMSPNGADRQRLTSPSGHDTDPTYSPNGKSIAFLRVLGVLSIGKPCNRMRLRP
jgi:Tol biopolymer transport system component